MAITRCCNSVRRSAPFILAGAAAFALAAFVPARRVTEPVDTVASSDDELEHAMEQMNAALKSLLKGVNADNRDAALEQIAKFQSGVLVAKLRKPASADKVAEKERPEFLADYRKTLVRVLTVTCETETAILEGKLDDANALIKNKLTGLKKEGHDKFQEGEEEQ